VVVVVSLVVVVVFGAVVVGAVVVGVGCVVVVGRIVVVVVDESGSDWAQAEAANPRNASAPATGNTARRIRSS
jgi:hypothetical protein